MIYCILYNTIEENLLNTVLRFHYKCPNMYNKADFVISILNSDGEKAKRNVDEMCKWSSADLRIDLNYDVFNNQVK